MTTFGKKGAVLLRRVNADAATAAATGEPQMLQPVLDSMFAELDEMPLPAHGTGPPAYTTRTGVAVFPGHVVKTKQPVTLQFDRYGRLPRLAPSSSVACATSSPHGACKPPGPQRANAGRGLMMQAPGWATAAYNKPAVAAWRSWGVRRAGRYSC